MECRTAAPLGFGVLRQPTRHLTAKATPYNVVIGDVRTGPEKQQCCNKEAATLQRLRRSVDAIAPTTGVKVVAVPATCTYPAANPAKLIGGRLGGATAATDFAPA